MDIRLAPLGPEGVRQRMEEIRARMAALAPSRQPGFSLEPQPEITGQIGGEKPFNPFGTGVSLSGARGGTAFRQIIEEAALDNNLDPSLLDALVQTESGYDPLARSHAGALGLTQLMPDTAKSMGVTNPLDPVQSVKGGAKYLASLIDKFGDLRTALAAYNAGPGAVERAGGIPNYRETQKYVERVMSLYEGKRR